MPLLRGYLNLTQKQKKARTYPKLVSERAAHVLTIFNICVTNDDNERHSKFMCHTCISKIRRAKKNGVGVIQSARQESENASHIWRGFSVCYVSQCSSCLHRQITAFVISQTEQLTS